MKMNLELKNYQIIKMKIRFQENILMKKLKIMMKEK